MLKDLMEIIAKQLVNAPEQVSVTEIENDQTVVLELRVAQSDLGKVIGKEGRTARALRVLLGAAANKNSKRVILEIIE